MSSILHPLNRVSRLRALLRVRVTVPTPRHTGYHQVVIGPTEFTFKFMLDTTVLIYMSNITVGGGVGLLNAPGVVGESSMRGKCVIHHEIYAVADDARAR